MNTIGEHIKEERIRKGMTQQKLAEKIFVTRQSISRYEKAERTPDLFTLQKLAEVLDTTIDELLDGQNMHKAVENSNVTHSDLSSHLAISLYSMILFSLLALLLSGFPSFFFDEGTILRIPLVLTQCAVLIYGMVQCIKDTMTPKETGIVSGLYFLMEAIQRGLLLTWNVFAMVPCLLYLLGALSSFFYLYRAHNCRWYLYGIIQACISGIVVQVYQAFRMLWYADHLYTGIHTLSILCSILIHILFLLETMTITRRRKQTGHTNVV